MPFQIVQEDILTLRCDAIVDTADERFGGNSGLETGEAVVTESQLPNCPFLIHTAVPRWTGRGEELALLRRCYRSALQQVERFGFPCAALPPLGSGEGGFPEELVLKTAAEEIGRFLARHGDTWLLLAVRDKSELRPGASRLAELDEYIELVRQREEREQQAMLDMASTGAFPAIRPDDLDRPDTAAFSARPHAARESMPKARKAFAHSSDGMPESGSDAFSEQADPACGSESMSPFDFSEIEHRAVLDESFSKMVLRLIDEKGFKKDSDCYNRANIDRRLFSRIRCDESYHPKKTTALALAIALRLSLSETRELLLKAGYSLSHSILLDVIVEYCILQRCYDIVEINALLFQYDQPLLGG